MWAVLLKIISLYFLSMIKFILGPLGGYAEGVNIFLTMLATAAGMMTVVMVLTFFGDTIYRWISKFRSWIGNRLPHRTESSATDKQHRWRDFFRRFGISGIAFLTPVILTPIGGTLLAVGFGIPRRKVVMAMLMSALFWSVLLTFGVYYGIDTVVSWAQDAAIY